jgi:hypothetical protein
MIGAVSLLTVRLHGNFTHLYWSFITINLHERAKFSLVYFLEELDKNTLFDYFCGSAAQRGSWPPHS